MVHLVVSAVVVAAAAAAAACYVQKIVGGECEKRETSPHNAPNSKGSAKEDNYIQNKQSSAITGEETPKTAKIRQKTPPKKTRSNKRAVVNMDTGAVFESAEAAGRYYKCDSSAIIKCCKGKQRTSKGFRWAYEFDGKSNRK